MTSSFSNGYAIPNHASRRESACGVTCVAKRACGAKSRGAITPTAVAERPALPASSRSHEPTAKAVR